MMNYQSAAQLKKLAKIIAAAGVAAGKPLGLGEALDALAKANGFQAWSAMAPTVSLQSVDEQLSPIELANARDHVQDSSKGAYPAECVLQVQTGFYLCAPAYPQDCEYVRVCDPLGREIVYWHWNEWVEDPQLVMGAILGSLARGGSTNLPVEAATQKSISLPFGVCVTVAGPAGTITSDLPAALCDEDDSAEDRALANGAVEALEAFLLAMACEGLDLSDKRVHRALSTTVEILADQL